MNVAHDLLERRLIVAYTEQIRHYERALQIVNAPGREDDLLNPDGWIHDLSNVLRDVACCDVALGQDKAAWEKLQRTPAAELRGVLDRLAELIRLLSEKIDHQIADLLARRQRFLPEIDAFSRQRQMLQAYESNSGSAQQ